MSWKRKSSFIHTLTFRITLWYAALFGVLSLAVFLVVYLSLTSSLSQRTDEELLNTASEFETLYRTSGIQALQGEFRREAESRGIGRVFFRFLSPRGRVLAASDLAAWKALASPRFSAVKPKAAGVTFATVRFPGHRSSIRLFSNRTADGHILQLGTTLHDNELLMERYRWTFAAALGVMLLCGAVVGWFVSRRAMAGVERVRQAAVSIGKGDLGRRVPLRNEGREIDDLAFAFNEMLDRIQALVRELEEVTNSIAHDLRSPLTRIRGIAETTLTSEPNPDALREMAGAVIEESDRLVEMINTMLEIAQTDSGVAQLSKTTVDMRRIAREAVDLFLPLAEDKRVNLDLDTSRESLLVNGDIARLQRVVANLVDNAIKYTEAGGKISVSVKAVSSQVIVEVSDTGIGIAETDLPHVFERFYRGDRSRSTPGNGLGLSLARSIIRAHGGRLQATSSSGRGSTFTVLLPRSSSSVERDLKIAKR